MIELVAVVGIVGVLLTLLVPTLNPIRNRVEKVVCVGNLRSLHGSLNSYLIDNEQWPQCPDSLDRAGAEKFWMDNLAPYGATPRTWTCPTLQRALAGQSQEEGANAADVPKIHYMPAQFNSKASTPLRWPGMPWVLEIGSLHGCGCLLIRADGAVKEMDDLMREANAPQDGVSVTPLK